MHEFGFMYYRASYSSSDCITLHHGYHSGRNEEKWHSIEGVYNKKYFVFHSASKKTREYSNKNQLDSQLFYAKVSKDGHKEYFEKAQISHDKMGELSEHIFNGSRPTYCLHATSNKVSPSEGPASNYSESYFPGYSKWKEDGKNVSVKVKTLRPNSNDDPASETDVKQDTGTPNIIIDEF